MERKHSVRLLPSGPLFCKDPGKIALAARGDGAGMPLPVQKELPAVVSFCGSPVPLLRERAENALGRIGRGAYRVIEPNWADLFRIFCSASMLLAPTAPLYFAGQFFLISFPACDIILCGSGLRTTRLTASGNGSAGLCQRRYAHRGFCFIRFMRFINIIQNTAVTAIRDHRLCLTGFPFHFLVYRLFRLPGRFGQTADAHAPNIVTKV